MPRNPAKTPPLPPEADFKNLSGQTTLLDPPVESDTDENNAFLQQILDDNERMSTELASASAQLAEAQASIVSIESVRAENLELRSLTDTVLQRLSSLESQVTSGTKAARQTSDEMDRVIPESDIQAFLSTPRPLTEFFTPGLNGGYGWFYKFFVQRNLDFIDPNTKLRTVQPEICIEARRWCGPGSELRDPRTGKVEKWGYFDLTWYPQIAITADDIIMYGLPPETKIRHGNIDLSTILSRVCNPSAKDVARRHRITGEEFRAIVSAKYDSIGRKRESERMLALRMATLADQRQAKLGLGDDVGVGQFANLTQRFSPAQQPNPASAPGNVLRNL